MNKTEYQFWRDKYNEEELTSDGDTEEVLRKQFQVNRFMSKSDLEQIVRWKFKGRLIGRQKRILRIQSDLEDKLIQDVSRLAFETDNDVIRIKLLSCIDGVGNALASVILTFFDPQRYGVLDIHSWRELFGKEPGDVFNNYKNAVRFFQELRKIAVDTGLPCRDIEKALFKKNLKENKTK